MAKTRATWRLLSIIFAAIWSFYARCPACDAPQRITKTAIRPGIRILCWRCKRIFSP